MKTYTFISLLLLLLAVTSCSTYQQVNTRINPDGSMEREFFAHGDSAFMAGSTDNNPFLFLLDDRWKITRHDSVFVRNLLGEDVKLNVSTYAKFSSPEEFSKTVQARTNLKQLALPHETLKKYFRWFYTYYTYTAVYSTIRDNLPLPLDFYLSDSEQYIFFQGDASAFEGMNGIEQAEILDDITSKFEAWFQHCEFIITLKAFTGQLHESGNSEYATQIPALHEQLFDMIKQDMNDINITSKFIASLLDKYFDNDFFSEFQAKNASFIENKIEQNGLLLALFEHKFYFNLEMPGNVVQANTNLRENNALVWKVDAYRFLAHNYTLKAESRKANVWAFVVATVLLLGIGLTIFISKKKYTSSFSA
ncbi:hypothetical protein LJC21_01230 [Bacteroides sp. OttesenSCG-928-E20]|nr:hypothetical protein [Bacteroides sp. OttesenSCG-928-N06]MDL2299310.1 hypothetical protein [Bacteroides sp. OttesenSCG-928-E20]